MWPIATRLADIWLNRSPRDLVAVQAARDAVAGLTPAVVVTGGSRGIGAALAKRFATAGHRVVVVARGEEQLAKAAAAIEHATATQVTTLSLDLTAPDMLARLDRDLAASGCYLDVLVNSAGVGLSGPFAAHDPAGIDELLALNITALTQLTRHALPGMLARRRGGILNVASLGAYIPGPGQAAYYASKSYVLSLTEALAAEASGRGVRICALVPGPADTEFHAKMHAEQAMYRKIFPSLSADRVARAGYRGFTLGQRVVAPGLVARISLTALKLLPHPISVPLIAWLLKNQQMHK